MESDGKVTQSQWKPHQISWNPIGGAMLINSRSQKEAPAILNQMETQFQISKGSPSNTKSNGNSIPDLKRKPQQY